MQSKADKQEYYRSRYLASWREREIDKDGTLKPFSEKELEHIILLNNFFNHLSLFTVEDIIKLKPENFTSGVKITL